VVATTETTVQVLTTAQRTIHLLHYLRSNATNNEFYFVKRRICGSIKKIKPHMYNKKTINLTEYSLGVKLVLYKKVLSGG